jgi:hypothetical protein
MLPFSYWLRLAVCKRQTNAILYKIMVLFHNEIILFCQWKATIRLAAGCSVRDSSMNRIEQHKKPYLKISRDYPFKTNFRILLIINYYYNFGANSAFDLFKSYLLGENAITMNKLFTTFLLLYFQPLEAIIQVQVLIKLALACYAVFKAAWVAIILSYTVLVWCVD